MTPTPLPIHPRTGLTAVGYRRDGRPIWPILGASDDGGEPPAPEGQDGPPGEPKPPSDEGRTYTQADIDKAIEARLARERAKFKDYGDLKAKADRLDQIEAANASDLEKAVKAAQDETRAAVAREYGERLARGVMKAQLTQSLKPADAEALLDDLNLAKFVGDDGTVDEDAIAKAVARIAPTGRRDLGQGSGKEGPSLDEQIAEATKRGDSAEAIRLTNQKLFANR